MFEVHARFPGSRPELIEAMRTRGVNAFASGRATIVVLPPGANNDEFVVPPECADAQLQLVACEWGGRSGEKREATIVCGFGGKPLVPFFVGSGDTNPCAASAKFAVPHGVMVVQATGDLVEIFRCSLALEKRVARVISRGFWRGEMKPTGWLCSCGARFRASVPDLHHVPRSGLPEDGWLCFDRPRVVEVGPTLETWRNEPAPRSEFGAAMFAAWSKARCSGCKHPHFVAERIPFSAMRPLASVS